MIASVLVLAAAHHPRPFNTNFYVAVATLLPVLYIAVMLPGGALSRMMEISRREAELPQSRISRAMDAVSFLLIVLGTQADFVVSETQAIWALGKEHAGPTTHDLVLWSALVMVVAVATFGANVLSNEFAAVVAIKTQTAARVKAAADAETKPSDGGPADNEPNERNDVPG